MNPFIVRKFIYPVYRAIKRDRVLAYLAEMRRVQSLDPERIREYQWDKLKKLVEYASEHVPYYRSLFKKLGAKPEDWRKPEDLQYLPILRKREIREHLDDLISEAYPREGLKPDRTSGSTGESLYYYVDRGSLEAQQASDIRMNQWIGIGIGDRKVCL